MSDLPFVTDRNGGGGRAGRDVGTGGQPLSIQGHAYSKGLGVRANSTVVVALNTKCTAFFADIGLDDAALGAGSARFQVFDENDVPLFDSDVVTGGASARHISVNVAGRLEMKLLVTSPAGNPNKALADWADAQLQCRAIYLSDATPTQGAGTGLRSDASVNGRSLSVQGASFVKGVSMASPADVTYTLGGKCFAFAADIGVDDETAQGQADLTVRVDGQQVFDSGTLQGGKAATHVSFPLGQTANQVRFTVTTGAGAPAPHVDLGNAVLLCTDALTLTQDPALAFLSRDGVGTQATADAYYRSIGAPVGLTLTQWITDNLGNASVASGFYRNAGDLGFWREMSCSQTLAAGTGGCWVRNWRNPGDKAQGLPNLGTVTMNVSPQGFTRFYVFDPNGVLTTQALLDSEGPKFVPNLCSVCHGGKFDGQNPDMGSVFREFEPTLLQARPGITAATAESEWFSLNAAARTATVVVAGEAAGGKPGVDATKQGVLAHMDLMYPDSNNPVARRLNDAAYIPDSWKVGTPEQRVAQMGLWTGVVNPYCMGCHRVKPASTVDVSNYASFRTLKGTSPQGGNLMLSYIMDDPKDPRRQSYALMPQAELTFQLLQGNSASLTLINRWLAQGQ